MPNKKFFFVIFAVLLSISISEAASKQWLHVRVDKASEDGERVRLNIPLSLVEIVLPMVQEKAIEQGKLKIDDKNLSKSELKKMWEAVKAERNTDFLTVQKRNETVRVFIEGKYMMVQANDEGSSKNVDIKLPLAVVDAMLSGSGEELNLMAGVKALQESGLKDIISVKDRENTVRVWIDESNEAK